VTNTLLAVHARALTRDYILGRTIVPALRGTDLEIPIGQHVAVVGPSGSGKSTLLNLIGCLDRPTSGSLELNGTTVSDLSETELARVRNEELGFIFQQFRLLPRATAIENVALPLLYRGVDRQRRLARAASLLGALGLADRLEHLPSELSGGQQQRVAIARALVGKPSILLADEPTGALDSQTANEVLSLLEGLRDQGMTLLVVTHDPEVASRAERVVRFADGVIVSDELTRPC
jgi:putative ABC transport system ATP-binding protein